MANPAPSAAFDAISNLEGACFELTDIRNVLEIYSESLERDLEPCSAGKPWAAQYLARRWPLYHSILSVIAYRLNAIIPEMHSSVEDCYAAFRAYRQNNTSTPPQAAPDPDATQAGNNMTGG